MKNTGTEPNKLLMNTYNCIIELSTIENFGKCRKILNDWRQEKGGNREEEWKLNWLSTKRTIISTSLLQWNISYRQINWKSKWNEWWMKNCMDWSSFRVLIYDILNNFVTTWSCEVCHLKNAWMNELKMSWYETKWSEKAALSQWMKSCAINGVSEDGFKTNCLKKCKNCVGKVLQSELCRAIADNRKTTQELDCMVYLQEVIKKLALHRIV